MSAIDMIKARGLALLGQLKTKLGSQTGNRNLQAQGRSAQARAQLQQLLARTKRRR